MFTPLVSSVAVLAQLAFTAAPAFALEVAPRVLIIDNNEPSGAVLLENDSPTPISIQVDVRFGYDVADRQGRITTHYPRSARSDRSAVDFLRLSVRRTQLAPGEDHIIFIEAVPPKTLPVGEYWARARIREVALIPGHDGSPPVEVTTSRHVPIFYRHGRVAASARIQAVNWSVDVEDRRLTAHYFIGVEGMGAYLGQIEATVVAADGATLASQGDNLSVFVSGWRKLHVALDGPLPKGATLELRTRRAHSFVLASDLLPGRDTAWSQKLASR